MQSFPVIPSSEPKLVWGVICSSIFHLLLIILLVGVPSFSSPKRTYFSSAYMVKLVDTPKRKGAGVKISHVGKKQAGKGVGIKTSKEKAKKTSKKKKTKEKESSTLSIKDKKKESGTLQVSREKQMARGTEGAFSLALNKIRNRVEERRKKEEVAKIREKIAEEESEEGGEGGEFTVGPGGIPPGKGIVADLPLNYRLYYQFIEQKIKNNWNLALPRGVIEDMRGMEVVLSIIVRSDGEISKVSFEKKTGNVYLDDSAFRAVKKSSPLPPFSEYNIREPFFETGIIFPAGELL